MAIKKVKLQDKRFQGIMEKSFDKDCYLRKGSYLNRPPVDKFKDDQEAREYWQQHGDRLLIEWRKWGGKNIDSMPFGWFKFEKGLDLKKMTIKQRLDLQAEIDRFWA